MNSYGPLVTYNVLQTKDSKIKFLKDNEEYEARLIDYL
jgi:hypothetical protein